MRRLKPRRHGDSAAEVSGTTGEEFGKLTGEMLAIEHGPLPQSLGGQFRPARQNFAFGFQHDGQHRCERPRRR